MIDPVHGGLDFQKDDGLTDATTSFYVPPTPHVTHQTQQQDQPFSYSQFGAEESAAQEAPADKTPETEYAADTPI